MKSHVQYFLMQYRKKPQTEKDKIKNKIGYFTNAVKGNQRRKEWNKSKEFLEMQKVHETVAEELKEEALKLFPDDEMRQNMFVDQYYLQELGEEMRRIRRDFDRKSTVV